MTSRSHPYHLGYARLLEDQSKARQATLRVIQQQYAAWKKAQGIAPPRKAKDPQRARPVKHIYAKAGTAHISGSGVYAMDHLAEPKAETLALVREIEARYAEIKPKLEPGMKPSYIPPKIKR